MELIEKKKVPPMLKRMKKKLKKEDILKYGTKEEVEFLKEGLANEKSIESERIGNYVVSLAEERLSDGSKGYNIYFSYDDQDIQTIPLYPTDLKSAENMYMDLIKIIRKTV
jgi:hypothetical protein